MSYVNDEANYGEEEEELYELPLHPGTKKKYMGGSRTTLKK